MSEVKKDKNFDKLDLSKGKEFVQEQIKKRKAKLDFFIKLEEEKKAK